MLFQKNKVFISVVFALTLNLAVLAEHNMYQLVAKENLKTMAALDQEQGCAVNGGSTLNDLIDDSKEFYDVIKETLDQQLHPKKSSKRQMVFSLLSEYDGTPPCSAYTVLDETSWQDLELLAGPKSNLNYYVASRVDRTSTEMGRAILYQKIISPVADYATLVERQNLVKLLVERQDLFDELNKRFAALEISENAMLSFWLESDLFKSLQQQMMIRLPLESKIPLFKKISQLLNTSELMLECNGRLAQCTSIATGLMHTFGACVLPAYILARCSGHKNLIALAQERFDQVGSSGLAIFSATGLLFYLLDLKYQNTNPYVHNGKNTAAGITSTYFASQFPVYLRTDMILVRSLQEKLMHIARYWNSVQKIIKRVQDDELLSRALPQISALDFSKKSQEIKHLLTLLSTPTFRGTPSIFSYTGRIISAYRLLSDHKHENSLMRWLLLENLMRICLLRGCIKNVKISQCVFVFPSINNPQIMVGRLLKRKVFGILWCIPSA